MADWQKIGSALSGFSAGVNGTLPQFVQARTNEAEVQRQARDEARKNLLLANRGALVDLQAGRIDNARAIIESSAGLVPQEEVSRLVTMLDRGDTQGVMAELAHLDKRAVATGMIEPVADTGLKPSAKVVDGQVVFIDPQAGTARASAIEGFVEQPGEAANRQAAGNDIFKDEAGNFFSVTRVFDPSTGKASAVAAPIGHESPQAGRLSPVNTLGLFAGEIPGQKNAEQTAVETAKTSAGLAKAAYEKLSPIGQTIGNINKAITAIDQGANTGPIYKMLPNITQASILLENTAAQMGLDVINSATFGALSEKELAFAIDSALPTGLEPDDLRKWLVEKRDAQEKLATELRKAASYMGRGMSMPDYLDLMEAEGRYSARKKPQPAPRNEDIPKSPGAPPARIRILSVEG